MLQPVAREAARFRGEAEVLARLEHPNIVRIYEVGEYEGGPYFAMEFVTGGSLQTKLRGAPQPVREAAALVETLREPSRRPTRTRRDPSRPQAGQHPSRPP